MATVLGTNVYWPPNSSASNRSQQNQTGMNINGSVGSSNSSASSLTTFNFDDSGVGTEDHQITTMMLENGTSPHFYAPPQQLPHFNNIYQPHPPIFQHPSGSPSENVFGNNNALFKDLDGASKNYLNLLNSDTLSWKPLTSLYIPILYSWILLFFWTFKTLSSFCTRSNWHCKKNDTLERCHKCLSLATLLLHTN